LKSKTVAFASLFVSASLLISCSPRIDKDEVSVLETSYGKIVIEFFPKDAPKNVANFQRLAREGFFDGTKFHRLLKDKSNEPVAIQAGDPNTISGDPSTWGKGQPGQRTVSAEFSKTLKHVRGIVAMARRPNDNDSATSQFFIMVRDYPEFDGQYTIFGRVIEGMNVVDAIGRAPVYRNTDRPLDPVVVTHVYLMKRDAVEPGNTTQEP
jgi:peptidyl-prolyl cis-trans isomerase B (cyclophilin B)